MANFKSPIKHIMVVMFENRSFDHLLGFQFDWPVGLNNAPPDMPLANTDPTNGSPRVPTPDAAWDDLVNDPGHEPAEVYTQLYGGPWDHSPVNSHNVGFVSSYHATLTKLGGAAATLDPQTILRCFGRGKLPTYSSVASNFTVCGAWHSSVPGPTWPNRYFLHTGTSLGMVESYSKPTSILKILFHNHFPASIFSWVQASGLTWKIYESYPSQCNSVSPLQSPTGPDAPDGTCTRTGFDTLWSDLQNGTLPSYSFVEPVWHGAGQNDMHPGGSSDMRMGDDLLRQLVNGLAASLHWQDTALVVLCDEHGGTYDHVFPPNTVAPDDHRPDGYDFQFDRLGVRVPAMIVSAYSPAKVEMTLFDHTSVIASVADLFGLGKVPDTLGKRAQQAKSFAGSFDFTKARPAPTPLAATKGFRPRYKPQGKLDDNQRANLILAAALREAETTTLRAQVANRSSRAMVQHPAFQASAARITRTVNKIQTLAQLDAYMASFRQPATGAPAKPKAKKSASKKRAAKKAAPKRVARRKPKVAAKRAPKRKR